MDYVYIHPLSRLLKRTRREVDFYAHVKLFEGHIVKTIEFDDLVVKPLLVELRKVKERHLHDGNQRGGGKASASVVIEKKKDRLNFRVNGEIAFHMCFTPVKGKLKKVTVK